MGNRGPKWAIRAYYPSLGPLRDYAPCGLASTAYRSGFSGDERFPSAFQVRRIEAIQSRKCVLLMAGRI